jgi:hypothetical protein
MDIIKMGEETSSAQAIRSQELVSLIGPMLHGQGPDVQGAALCDLCAIWLAGHHPDVRAAVLAEFMVTLVRLAAVNEKLIFGEGGFPKEGVN